MVKLWDDSSHTLPHLSKNPGHSSFNRFTRILVYTKWHALKLVNTVYFCFFPLYSWLGIRFEGLTTFTNFNLNY